MSVLKSKRKVSSLEFLRKARELEIYMSRISDKKIRKYPRFMFDNFVRVTYKVYTNLKIANSIYISDDNSYDRRTAYVTEAYELLQGFTSQLDIFYKMYGNDGLSDKEFETLSELSTDCRRLIIGVMKYDKETLKRRTQS